MYMFNRNRIKLFEINLYLILIILYICYRKKRNMVRKKDRIWEYVKESNGRFMCKFCERDFPGGASRIKSHLAGVRGRDIDLCIEVPKDVQAEAYLATRGPRKKLKSASNLSNAEEIKTPTSRSNDLPQTTMLEMCKKKDQSVQWTNCLPNILY